MQFSVGHIVVHPHHGPARVRSVTERRIGGTMRDYVQLDIQDTDLSVSVPVDTADEVGIRAVLSPGELEEVYAILRAPEDDPDATWAQRFQANRKRLATGDIKIIAQVVRDLSRRLLVKSLSTSENRMLADARQPLVSEMAHSLNVPADEADVMLDAVIAEGAQAPALQAS